MRHYEDYDHVDTETYEEWEARMENEREVLSHKSVKTIDTNNDEEEPHTVSSVVGTIIYLAICAGWTYFCIMALLFLIRVVF